MVTTEICVFTLLDTITLQDLLNPSKTPHSELLKTVRSQPGCQSLYWGVGIQDPTKLFWFIEWDHLTSHQLFQSLPSYPSFVSTAIALTNPSSPSPLTVLHYNLPTPLSHFPKSQKPYLEYFSLPTLPSSSTSLSETFESLQTAFSTFSPEGIPSTYSFAIDEGSENICLSLIGWKDKEQHAAFLKTDAFVNAEPKMREVAAGPPVAIHVDLQEWE
ncbi:hypothetical protein TWF506_006379 [Arthrobotrys conoides]|uniref:ABM domain-containing protein n=1 Tax=Arthrobotrys conoides TaxID=74498 RepID=A0AAN8P290_9PEZI